MGSSARMIHVHRECAEWGTTPHSAAAGQQFDWKLIQSACLATPCAWEDGFLRYPSQNGLHCLEPQFNVWIICEMIAAVDASNRDQTQNRLLRAIPVDELSQALSISERVQLHAHQILHEYMVPIDHVYFIESGLVSVAAKVGHDKFVEVWLVGSEGMVGAPVVLGAATEPRQRRTVQVDGRALRIRTPEFRKAMEILPTFRKTVHAYLNVVLFQASQSGACNSTHNLAHRLARWLLVARSCLDADDIPLTHGVLAQLLGVRRASVTECLEQFESQGLINTKYGQITIGNSDRLGEICCECFSLIAGEYERQLASIARDTS
jgi:CRP-like cAMP-binding protein